MALEAGKYTIAWFKLAEFVWRKEKERALAMYKLLAHSLSDEALACQLEGDILLSFRDEKALVSYTKAATLYEKYQKFPQAAAVYEHLAFLTSSIDHAHKMVQLYARLQNTKKTQKAIQMLVDALAKQNSYHLVDSLANDTLKDHAADLYEQAAIKLLVDQSKESSFIERNVKKALESHASRNSSPHIFLNKLRALDESTYSYACSYEIQR